MSKIDKAQRAVKVECNTNSSVLKNAACIPVSFKVLIRNLIADLETVHLL